MRQGFLLVLSVAVGGAWLLVAPASAQTSYPMIARVEPVVVTRGTSVELTISGREKFDGAFGLICQEPGVRGEVLKVAVDDRPAAKARPGRRRQATPVVKARLEVAADAPLGPREVRVATPQGVSSVGLVVVGDEPVVLEGDDKANDRPENAQRLTLPAAVSGRISRVEDIDWYAFEAEQGEWIALEIWANRLENKIHDLQTHFDPILTLYDAQSRRVAVADNTYSADPLLAFRAPLRGIYYLEVRDTTYAGNAAWCYGLRATRGPVATSVYPMAIRPGTAADLEVNGPGFDPPRRISLPIPKDVSAGVTLFSMNRAGGGPRPVPMVVVDHPVTVESTDAPDKGDSKAPVALPAAIGGRLAKRGDIDGFCFAARKGEAFEFEVIAGRAGSECDPVLRVLDAKGTVLTESDDTRGLGKDARLDWKAPADGVHALQVTDLHDRGGPGFGYVLVARPARPDFVVTCDPDKINVGPGGRVPVFVKLDRRHGFAAPVRMEWEGLPAGVSASPLSISAGMTEGLVVISAEPDARRAAGLVTLHGHARGHIGPMVRKATPQEEIYIPGGGRGRLPVETLALAVTDAADIAVEASTGELMLAPGSSVTVDVTVTRNPRYDQPVSLAMVLQHLGGVHANPLPPGVSVKEAGSKTLLGPKETKGRIVLQAAPNAPECEKVPIAVLGHVSINFVVKTAYASKPILVSVKCKPGGGA